MSKFHQGKW
uniref:Uncharacterized protein n=1 Tax=Arundo donax TaxID=35708 RepID=A0A0A8ZR74_ARUDO